MAKGSVFLDVFSQEKKHRDINNAVTLKDIYNKDTDYFYKGLR